MKILFSLILLLLSPALFALEEWRNPDADNIVYLQLDGGTVIIELAPFIAPKHVARFKALVNEGYYDGLDFYRVIDGFVAQAGDITEQKLTAHSSPLGAEFSRKAPADSNFTVVQSPDFIAPQTGFLNGFIAGRDPITTDEWLLHYPGNVAMARSTEINSATSDFYIVMGQAPRHLDRNMSSFGHVLYGMSIIQALHRAENNNPSGIIEKPEKRSKIISAKMANKLPIEQRINIQVQEPASAAMQQRLTSAKTLDNEFFYFKGNGNLDMCYYQLKTRIVDK
ncbi:peptidylprolyl isomerase [Paraglaciecola sp. 25GB23A]|uniref:peptidylprolyl isomerase n=1 Tax=Paraglaciecola sp. 25GB23A TaxID=3156068 RepID=UPI0032AFFAE0